MVEFVPRIQLEVVVHDEMVDEVVNVIQKYAHTGNAGDGKIFVSTVDDMVKIRTNERGEDAL
jgi:nitrogen regulatory protein P-II 1